MKYYQNWRAGIYSEGKCEEYFPAAVPGNVQSDYAKHIGIDDIQYASNVKRLEAVEDCFWEYRTELIFERKENERIFFVAEGIDYKFDIMLNGRTLYSSEGMYTPTELDITDIVHKYSVLQVIIHPHPKAEGEIPKCRREANQSCKPPMCYEWDWNPRLLISGLWKPAYIETRSKGYISNCEPFYTLDLENMTADVRFEVECDSEVLLTLCDAEGKVVYSGKSTEFKLKDIKLWWCNGLGEPYLYSWTAQSDSDIKCGKIGFRTVSLVQNIGADGSDRMLPKTRYAAAITVELNGVRIFAKGSNWVNPELFTGTVTKECYEQLILSAKLANMNILRVWGGAGINKNEFYELCDQHGTMVWQEFMLACNNYKGTKEYLTVLEKEAISVIKVLRRYASVILWCGGNELFNDWSGMDEQSHALRLLNKLCYEHDFERPFLMTSPSYGMAHGGYFFLREQDGKDIFEIFNGSHNTAYSEFGVSGIASVEQLKKIIPEGELFPIEKTESWITHHAFKAWGEEAWLYKNHLTKFFGEFDNLEELVEHSQWLQSIGYKAVFEEARRQWPYCSMALNWCFNEPWITAANNSIISYPCVKKQAYYSVTDSLRPTMASARIPKFSWTGGENFTAQIWYLNDTLLSVSDTVTVTVIVGEKDYTLLKWETGEIEANTNKLGPAINFMLPECEKIEKIILKLSTENENTGSSYELYYHSEKIERDPLMMNV